jgi:hypothetical protein
MMERRYFTTRKEHALHVIAVWCNSIVADIKTVGGFAATVFSMSITQSCLLSIDALSSLPFKISPELGMKTLHRGRVGGRRHDQGLFVQ